MPGSGAGGVRFAKTDFEPLAAEEDSATRLLLGLGADLHFSKRFLFRADAALMPVELSGDDERFGDATFNLGLGFRF